MFVPFLQEQREGLRGNASLQPSVLSRLRVFLCLLHTYLEHLPPGGGGGGFKTTSSKGS